MAKQKSNFSRLSVTELVEMRDQIERALGAKVAQERNELQARLDALSGFETRAVNGGGGRGRGRPPKLANGRSKKHALKGRKVPVKYRGPGGETWTGRGLAPRWLAALEAKGKKRESYLV